MGGTGKRNFKKEVQETAGAKCRGESELGALLVRVGSTSPGHQPPTGRWAEQQKWAQGQFPWQQHLPDGDGGDRTPGRPGPCGSQCPAKEWDLFSRKNSSQTLVLIRIGRETAGDTQAWPVPESHSAGPGEGPGTCILSKLS